MKELPKFVEEGVIAGNFSDKYESRNPIARLMIRGYLRTFDELVETSAARKVHEVGCGEGVLTLRLARKGFTVQASDFSKDVVAFASGRAAQEGLSIHFRTSSIYDLQPIRDKAPLVVCCEVLEHLERPVEALKILSGLADPFLLLSVPREPIWRMLNLARLKYVGDLGNTPGHIQHWSATSFLKMVSEFFDIVQVRRPLPWTFALCRPKRR